MIEKNISHLQFINMINEADELYNNAINEEDKMNAFLNEFLIIDKYLTNRIKEDGLDIWMEFIYTVYVKSSEFIQQNTNNNCSNNNNLVKTTFDIVNRVNNYVSNIIKTCNFINNTHLSIHTKMNIIQAQNKMIDLDINNLKVGLQQLNDISNNFKL